MPASALPQPIWQPLLLPRLESVAPADIAAFLRARREYEHMAASAGHPVVSLKSSVAFHILEYLCAVHMGSSPITSSQRAGMSPFTGVHRSTVADDMSLASPGARARALGFASPRSPLQEPIRPQAVADQALAQCLEAMATSAAPAAAEAEIHAKLRFPERGGLVDRVSALFAEFFKIVRASSCPSFIEEDPARSIAHILRVLRPRYLSESIRFEITHCHRHLQKDFRRFARYVVRHVAASYHHVSEADLCSPPPTSVVVCSR